MFLLSADCKFLCDMREYELLLELLKLVTASNYHTTDTSS